VECTDQTEHRAHRPASTTLARSVRAAVVGGFVALVVAAGAAARGTVPDDDTLREGAQVFSQVCQSCHQPGGVGLAGKFPPLKDNPNVADAAYVAQVINNGRQGEIVVNGTTYNGVMPPQSTLSDGQVTSVIAYIQSGFQAPASPAPAAGGPVAGTELPGFANLTILAAFAGALGVFALILGPRVIGVSDRRTMPWLDAWLKTSVIVVGFIVFTVLVPAKVLETETVADLPRPAQDIIASGLWLGGLAAGLLALWYAHRERRI
jgi:mono/diheme cytochrome c family protein/uncharacterized Tic20 family protein